MQVIRSHPAVAFHLGALKRNIDRVGDQIRPARHQGRRGSRCRPGESVGIEETHHLAVEPRESVAPAVQVVGVVREHQVRVDRGVSVQAIVDPNSRAPALVLEVVFSGARERVIGGPVRFRRRLPGAEDRVPGIRRRAETGGKHDAQLAVPAKQIRKHHAALGTDRFAVGIVRPTHLVRNQPTLALQRALRLQVHAAADGVGVHVRSRCLGHLDRVDEIGREGVDLERPPQSAPRAAARSARAVDRHRIEIGIDAANFDEGHLAFEDFAGDAGYPEEEVADVFVGHIAERVRGQDVFHVRCHALLRDREGAAFTFPGHDDGFELVDAGGESDFAHFDALSADVHQDVA